MGLYVPLAFKFLTHRFNLDASEEKLVLSKV